MPRLTIYVAAHCAGCHEAQRLAALARTRYPRLQVEVLDLGITPAARPPNVFAVPTYVLNGRVVSLGTPRDEELWRQVDAVALPVEGRA